LEQLKVHGQTDVGALAHLLGVSTVTVRTDLLFLEKAQMLRRIRGGAIAVRPSRYERPSDINASLHSAEKQAIATAAASMIHDGETIILDTGSTVEALANSLPTQLMDIAIVTSSLNVAMELVNHPGATVIVTGGTLRPKLHSLIQPLGNLILAEVNADVAFMSCAGVDTVKGFTNSNWHEAEVKKAMIKAAAKVVFLADHTKLKHVATARIAALHEVDTLITDSKASPDAVRELREQGVEVIVT
jgi:DeoR family transcriptional regulator of aga operon